MWSAAGLRAAAASMAGWDDAEGASLAQREAEALDAAVRRSLAQTAARLGRPAMPASPYRRLDAGAIGSIAAGYPLQLWPGDDPRLIDTVAHLLTTSFIEGGFFQTMSHAGINPYLTLHVAQVLLRAGAARAPDLMRQVGDLASPTGQWPEAVHPRTRGGCMGDGQHVWAAAEWIMAVRHSFVREEGDGLVLAGGIHPAWIDAPARFGPTHTPFGPISVSVERAGDTLVVRWDAQWRDAAPPMQVRLPGRAPVAVPVGQTAITVPA
jgi:hypothetical protein